MTASAVAARLTALMLLLGIAGLPAPAMTAPLSVVAAENVYGDLVEQLGGPNVAVVSILNNPSQDPHLFEAGASTARALADAALVIYNGADYDPWMPKLLSVSPGKARRIVVAAEVSRRAAGDNPHLWYDAAELPALARAITADLIAADPASEPTYNQRLQAFEAAMKPLDTKIEAMRTKYAGLPITATEPVFDYMARAIGLIVRNAGFQRAIMNGTEPSARDVAAFQDDLEQHRVRVLLYNTQATGNLAERMRHIAEQAKIPVVGVSETEPPGTRYQDWMANQLDALDAALAGSQ
jgi:zinc/manganese transport system substrate-binding protein